MTDASEPAWSGYLHVTLRWSASKLGYTSTLLLNNLLIGGVREVNVSTSKCLWMANLLDEELTWHSTQSEAKSALLAAALEALRS